MALKIPIQGNKLDYELKQKNQSWDIKKIKNKNKKRDKENKTKKEEIKRKREKHKKKASGHI
jgi:hypothetical protein